MDIAGPRIVFKFPIGDQFLYITETLVNSLILVILLSALAIWLGSKLEIKPTTKRQALAETIVNFMNKLSADSVGEGSKIYAPYVLALFLFIFVGAIMGLFGLRAVPTDINVTATFAAMTFFMIFYKSLRTHGLIGHMKGLATPAVLTPLNLLGEFTTPLAMAVRLFGNISSGAIITMLIYGALTSASVAVYNFFGMNLTPTTSYFNIFQIGAPAFLSIYFDLFSGCLQAYVFINLTLANVSKAGSD